LVTGSTLRLLARRIQISRRRRVSGSVDHPFEREPERTGEVVSLAGDIVRSKALDFLVDHAEIAS